MEEIASSQSVNGFDKMRNMLARAAEVRQDEQRQLYHMLEEVRSRLQPLENFAAEGRGRIPVLHDGVAAMQQRLGELPDRTEMSVIAERLDEALARIDGQDSVLAQVIGAMNALSERVGRPLDALEARLDGVAGRFEGVAGRLDGLDDRLLHLHGRLDELESAINRTQNMVQELPAQLDVGGRLNAATESVNKRLDAELGAVNGRLDQANTRLDDLIARPAVDPTERLEELNRGVGTIAERVESVVGRVDTVEDGIRTGVGTLSGNIEQGIDKLEGVVSSRPDREEVARTMRTAQLESERRITQQLDQALAAFAEVLLDQSMHGAATPRVGGRMAGKKSLGSGYDE